MVFIHRAESLFTAERAELPRTNDDWKALEDPARRRGAKTEENFIVSGEVRR